MTIKRQHRFRFFLQTTICSAVFLSCFDTFAQTAQYTGTAEETIITLPLADNVDYTIEGKDRELYLSFSRPLADRLQDIAAKLPSLVAAANIANNQKSMLLTLKEPLSVQNFRNDGNLIIKLRKQDGELADRGIDSRLNRLLLNYGNHQDFSRFSFEFAPGRKPEYIVKAGPETTTVSFKKRPDLKTSKLENYGKAAYVLQQINPEGGLDIIFPAKLKKSFEHENKIVFDLENSLLPQQQNTEIVPPVATAPINIRNQNLTRLQTAMTSAQVAPVQPNQVASLSFSWNMPVGLSVFRRGNYIWVIFDHPQNLDIESLREAAAPVADEVLQIPHPGAAILRILPKTKLNASVRKEGLLWIVDLFTRDAPEETKDLPVYTQYNVSNQPYLFIPSTAAGEVVSIIDPEVGDLIVTGTSTDIGLGIKDEYRYPDLTLLPTIQGVALNADALDIALSRGNTGYTIQAVRRGLNISPDLDFLKHQEQLNQIDNRIARLSADFNKELLGKTFAEAEDQLRQEIIKAEDEQKNNAKLELAKYYISQGLGTNALNILNKLIADKAPETETERFHGLLGVANFLAGRYEQALENFSFGRLPEINEAVFWRTLAASALEPTPENNAVLISYLNLVRNYPPEIRGAIAKVGAVTAIAAGDDITAQSFIDILKTMDTPRNLMPLVNYLTAEKILMQGYPRNAIQEYRKAANSNDLKYSSLARKKIADLEIRLNVIPPAKAIRELEGLRFAWGEIEFKKQLLSDLSDLYVRNFDYYQALRTLQNLEKISPAVDKPKIERRMVKLIEDIYLNNQADNLSALKSLALYQDYNWLPPKSRHYNAIIQKLADRLVAVDLLDRAYELLDSRLRTGELTALEKATFGSRLALIQLFNGQNHEALDILDRTETPGLPKTIELQRRIVRAKALSGTGNEAQALELLKDDYSKNALLLKSEIFWNGNMWGDAADAIKYLIEKPTPGQPLSEEQINYILDWATALKKAGRETVIVRLRNKFMPYFKDTKYYSAFSVLTDTLENDQINIRVIDKAINDIETFSDFAKIYNKSLLKSNLTEAPAVQNNVRQ